MARPKKQIKVIDIPEDNDLEFEDIPAAEPVKKKRGPKKKEVFPDLLDDETVTIEEEKPEDPEPEPEPVIQRKPMEIRQASIKDDLFCSYGWDNYSNNEFVGPSKHSNLYPVHADLRASFEKLNVHLASIFENDVTKADQVKVLAFKLDGKPTPTGVVFNGYKVLTSGEHGKVETPVTKFHGNYVNAEEMQEDVLNCISEIEKYHGGKHAPILVQQSFDFDDKEESDINRTIEGKKESLDADNEKFVIEMADLADMEVGEDEPTDSDPFAGHPNFKSSDYDSSNDDQLF